MRHTLACLIAVALAGPVAACLNDVELPGHEREFRSQYNKPTPPPVTPESESATPPGPSIGGMVAGGVGLVLLVGATVVTLRGSAARV